MARILVADDHDALRRGLALSLTTAGHDVEEAGNGNAALVVDRTALNSIGLDGYTINLANTAGVTSHTDLFNLVDINPNDYNFTVGKCSSVGLVNGCSQSPIDLKEVGYRMWQTASASYVDFAITVWDAPYRAGIWPPEFDIYIDTVRPGTPPAAYVPGPDGIPDYVVYNYENGGFAASGQEVVIVYNLHTGTSSVVFYLDSTFNSNNYILTVPASSIGLSIPVLPALAPAVLTASSKMNFEVLAIEAYMTGSVYDTSPSTSPTANVFEKYHSVDLLADRWQIDRIDQTQTVAPGVTVNVPYQLNPSVPARFASRSQIGFLALYREAPIQKESDALQLGWMFIDKQTFIPILSAP